VTSLGRRAKFIVIGLDPDTLLIHLRMSGDLRVEPDNPKLDQTHDRMILRFSDGTRLVFNDPRKFGRVWLVRDPSRVFAGLGPEPLDPSFTPQLLYERLHASRRQVKPLLLDQSFLAGLGNIYTDEALHRAKIHPLSSSERISPEGAARLWEAIRGTLNEGIQRNGASIDWVYRGGDFQNNFRVYQRTGQPCPVCGTPVERLVIGQRGSHFCPVCQVKEE
jgi:formamidopyrimidine-DNA glycosylase